jgi:TonB family protein
MNDVSFYISCLLNAVWQVTVIAGAGWLASCFLKKHGPEAEHAGWVCTLVVAALTPAAPFLISHVSLLLSQSPAPVHLSVVPASSQDQGPGFINALHLPVPVIWSLLTLYCCALLYFAVRLGWSLCAIRSLVRNAQPLHLDPEQQETWNLCGQVFALENAQILSSSEVACPIVLGIRNPILVMPTGFHKRCTSTDFLSALAHECAHAKRLDFQKNLCYEAITLVLAFHPAIWAIKAQLAQTREMICDSMVAERAMDSRAYAQSLLRLATMVGHSSRLAAAHAIGIFDANILEKRIMMMNLKRRPLGRALRFGLLTSALLLLSSAAVISAAKAIVIEPRSADQTAQATDKSNPYDPYASLKEMRAPQAVRMPVPTKTVEAKFPPSGKSLKKPFNATVLVGLTVDKKGMPREVHVVRSYNPDFDREAVKAVSQYRFKPATKDDGSPAAVALVIEVNFGLY